MPRRLASKLSVRAARGPGLQDQRRLDFDDAAVADCRSRSTGCEENCAPWTARALGLGRGSAGSFIQESKNKPITSIPYGGESGIRTHGTEGRILGPSSDYLLRNDWLSSLIGALLLATWNG
jgi:hypothetical protein